MSERIFISYRTADGADKATALARDLGQVFGHEAVFLDKEDLRGGSTWANEIGHALRSRPVVLLLVTPLLLAATDEQGRPRIAAGEDPVRREVEAALAANAHLIPVLCDGVDAPPAASTLPPPFDRLAELTWRRLRAYDWAADVRRLVDDLRAAGIPAPAAAREPRSRRPLIAAGAAVVALAAAGLAWKRAGMPEASPAPSPLAWPVVSSASATVPAPTGADRVAGRWNATLWHGEQVALVLTRTTEGLALASEPVPIDQRADWDEYRKFWREQTRTDLHAVMYRGEGQAVTDPGQALRIDVALKVLALPGGSEPVDSGNLSASLSADGRELAGRIWLNGAQSEQPAMLRREP